MKTIVIFVSTNRNKIFKIIIMKNSELLIRTMGVKGKSLTENKSIGYVINNIDNKGDIIIDAFKNSGDTYQRLESSKIDITNGDFYWSGTFDELIEKLK